MLCLNGSRVNKASQSTAEVINSVKVSISSSLALSTEGGAVTSCRADLLPASDFIQSAVLLGNGKPENTLMPWDSCSGWQFSLLMEQNIDQTWLPPCIGASWFISGWSVVCQVLMI